MTEIRGLPDPEKLAALGAKYRDSRSSTDSKPQRSRIEEIADEMAETLTVNRYGGGPDEKADLLARIDAWRGRLLAIAEGAPERGTRETAEGYLP